MSSLSRSCQLGICLLALAILDANDCGAQSSNVRRELSTTSDLPVWRVDQQYAHDIFTFVRIQYDSAGGYGRGGSSWRNDHPDSEINFSLRLQQLTSMQVAPRPEVFRLTDPAILDYPFLYMNGVGSLSLSEAEGQSLRRYLQNGGFLMLDDFWGDWEWQVVEGQLRRALPEWRPQQLPLSHEIFHVVYDFRQFPQVPGIRHWRAGRNYEDHGPGSERGPNFQGIFDQQGRLVVLLCHNNDLGDGWEREGEDAEYFQEFAVKSSYPMGLNIVVYAMTH